MEIKSIDTIEQMESEKLNGFYSMPFNLYLKVKAVSKSTYLDAIQDSPRTLQYNLRFPMKSSPAMALGTAFHCLTLEPDKFNDTIITLPKGVGQTTIKAKKMKSDFPESTVISRKQKFQAILMSRKIKRVKTSKQYLDMGIPEISCFWTHEETGLLCKNRFDLLLPDLGIIIDFKKVGVQSTLRDTFNSQIVDYKYYMQAAFYLMGLGKFMNPYKFIFIAVSDQPPIQVYFCTPCTNTLEQGKREIEKALQKIKKCKDTNNFHGYSEELQDVSLPRWKQDRDVFDADHSL